MIAAWKRKKELMPQYVNIIDAGINKLEDYLDEIEDIPAYTLAIRTYPFCLCNWFINKWAITVITPSIKLTWHQKHQEDKVIWAKRLFVDSVSTCHVILLSAACR